MSQECLIEGDYITKIGVIYETTSVLKAEISNGIHEYEFRIISYDNIVTNCYDLSIGIISSEYYENNKNDLIQNDEDSFVDHRTGYGYTTLKGRKQSFEHDSDYGVRCKKGDSIRLKT